MVPKPAPFPLYVGTDICRVSRIFRLLASHRGARFVDRILTSEELAHVPGIRDGLLMPLRDLSVPSDDFVRMKKEAPGLWGRASFLAGRFAAKEAAFKAHPWRRLSWHDVVIARERDEVRIQALGLEEGEPSANGSGPPIAVIKGKEGSGGDQMARISISHDGDYATAVCLGFKHD